MRIPGGLFNPPYVDYSAAPLKIGSAQDEVSEPFDCHIA